MNDRGEPLTSPGKQPRGRWREDAAQDPPAAVRQQPDARALNTGLACAEIVAVDVDILDQHLVDEIVHLTETRLGPTPLVRVGRAPKILLVYRWERPFRKIQTAELFLPDGQKLKVEVLAEGQQFVADGVHPDTGEPYRWTDESPETVHLSTLPLVSEEQVRNVIAEIDQLLHEAGAKPKEASGANGADAEEQRSTRAAPNGGSDFFRRVNDTALGDIGRWVRSLFPRARFEPGTGAWHVASKELGRELQEDISVHPAGVTDWGEEIPLTPIDLVMRYGSAVEAALWLCDKLAIRPETFGDQQPRKAPPGRMDMRRTTTAGEDAGVSLGDFYAYMVTHNYVFAPTRELWPPASVNSRIPPVPLFDAAGFPELDDKGKQKHIPAAAWLDQNRPVEQMTWAPGQPMIIKNRLIFEGGWIERDQVSCFNLYRPPNIKLGDPAQAKPFLGWCPYCEARDENGQTVDLPRRHRGA